MKRRFVLLITLVLLAGIASGCNADKSVPRLKAGVDRRTILIGDRIKFNVTVRLAKNIEAALPAFRDELIGDFEIKERSFESKKGLFGGRVLINRYLITVYTTGKHLIPPVEIKYRKKGSAEWSVVKSGEIPITVNSVLPPGKAVSDIKDIKGPKSFYEPNIPLIAGLIVFLILGAAGYHLYKKIVTRKPVRLAHETALEELEAIKGLLGRGGDIKECYAMVSDCIRYYIERRFQLNAPDMTTEEFLESLKNSHVLSVDHKRLLREFMTACDLVKFAKYVPSHEEVEAIFVTAKNFVEETKQKVSEERGA